MNRRLRSIVIAASLLVASGALPLLTASADACPNCKAANETDSRRPRAYMYSILFMIGMPATIFTGFGLSFYRMTRNAARQAEADAAQQLSGELTE